MSRVYQRKFKSIVRWYVDFTTPDGQRIRRKTAARTRSEAKEILKVLEADVERGEYRLKRSKKQVSFARLCQFYLEYSKNNKAEKSYTRDQTSIRKLKDFFGNTPMSKINPWQIEKYKKARKDKVRQGTVNRELACLKNMFTKAIEWKMAEENPAKKVKLYRETLRPIKPLTADEEERLIAAAENTPKATHLKPIILIALNTGMRLGEILNLRWMDIDLNERVITLTKTKNKEIRYIDMNNTVLNAIKEWQEKGNGDIFVFCDEDGKPFESIKTAYHRARIKAGIPKSFRFHDLRHTFASRLVMNGVDLRTVQELMGHKTIAMTMRYSHLTPSHKRQAVETLEKRSETGTYLAREQSAKFGIIRN